MSQPEYYLVVILRDATGQLIGEHQVFLTVEEAAVLMSNDARCVGHVTVAFETRNLLMSGMVPIIG